MCLNYYFEVKGIRARTTMVECKRAKFLFRCIIFDFQIFTTKLCLGTIGLGEFEQLTLEPR
jgi:hypothetical protein